MISNFPDKFPNDFQFPMIFKEKSHKPESQTTLFLFKTSRAEFEVKNNFQNMNYENECKINFLPFCDCSSKIDPNLILTYQRVVFELWNEFLKKGH